MHFLWITYHVSFLVSTGLSSHIAHSHKHEMLKFGSPGWKYLRLVKNAAIDGPCPFPFFFIRRTS
jgi:hypothetical protein